MNYTIVQNNMNYFDGPITYILMGISGTGKTTWAKKVSEESGIRVLSSEEIRQSIFHMTVYDASKNKEVFHLLRNQYDDCVARKESVIIDASNLQRWNRKQYFTPGRYTIGVVFEFELLENCIERNKNAKYPGMHILEHDNLLRDAAKFEEPELGEYFDEIWRVDVKGNIISVETQTGFVDGVRLTPGVGKAVCKSSFANRVFTIRMFSHNIEITLKDGAFAKIATNPNAEILTEGVCSQIEDSLRKNQEFGVISFSSNAVYLKWKIV